MKKTYLFLLLTVLALCVCVSAQAQSASIQLGEEVYPDDVFQDVDGTLLINCYDALYRADLQTGEVKKELTWENSPRLCQTDTGDIYAIYSDYKTNELVFCLLKDGALERQAVLKTQDYPSISKTAFAGGMICVTMWGNENMQLVTYRPGDKEAEERGAFGDPNDATTGLFEDEGKLCTLISEYNAPQYTIYRFDLEKNRGAKEKLTFPGTLYISSIAKDKDGTYYAVVRNWDTQEVTLQSGKTINDLAPISSIMGTDKVVPVEGDCLLVDGHSIYSYHLMENIKLTLVTSGVSSMFDTAFTLDTGIAVKSSEMSAADILNAKNGDVDIIAFRPANDPTLRVVKKKGFFVDLNQSEVLKSFAERMYPSISKHLYTEDGQLVGLFDGIDPIFLGCEDYLLEENGLSIPTTYGEMLDQVKVLDEAGVFGESYMPFDFFEYSRYSVAREVMKRFMLEQEVLGNKLNFDNDELRALLEKIVTELPRESPYPYADMPIYYGAGYGGLPEVLEQPCLRVGPSSPITLECYATILIVNPYSKHQAEAMQYLEYILAKYYHNFNDFEYYLFADMTEPVINEQSLERLEEVKARLAELATMEATTEVKDEISNLEQERTWLEENPYSISPEQIANWQEMVKYLAIPEDTLFSNEQLDTLVKRLTDGNLPVDDFLRECNKYIQMVYMERGE